MVYRTSKVFVPGGMPRLTYVPRKAIQLENRLRNAVENLHKLITVTGQTKSGKTVLVNTVLPRNEVDNNIWLDGGAFANENDFWSTILQNLGVPTSQTLATTAESTQQAAGSISGGIGILGTGVKGTAETGLSKKDSTQVSSDLNLTPRAAALNALRNFNGSIIIDDFHYLDREFQGRLVRALKPLIFEGLHVVFIAIPHRRYDAVRVEREMTGRVENIDVPSWSKSELREIAEVGFPLLNINILPEIGDRFASEAYGSPHLMQEFCQRISTENNVEVTSSSEVLIQSMDDHLFRNTAEGTGKVIYDKLARGPRQRSDRLQRALAAGGTTDIYGVVLLALSKLAPGLDSIEYEQFGVLYVWSSQRQFLKRMK